MRPIVPGLILLALAASPALASSPRHASPTQVAWPGPEAPGTIVVSTPERALYLVQGDPDEGHALRYPVAVGKSGFAWRGRSTIAMKREWPDWTPPREMRRRRPGLPAHMKGGPGNPLGARALYLSGTLYRIHGTNEPGSIGKAASSGCIRMFNDHVKDLYMRVGVGTPVVVR